MFPANVAIVSSVSRRFIDAAGICGLRGDMAWTTMKSASFREKSP